MILFVVLLVVLITIVAIYFSIPTLFLCNKKVKTVSGSKVEDIIPVIKGRWFFGKCLDFLKFNKEEFFTYLRENAVQLKTSYLLYALNFPILNIINPEYAEHVLNNPLAARKSFLYYPIKQFVRSGLLTSHGRKWHNRRKLITPTFHFSILKEFFEVFKEGSEKLLNLIDKTFIDSPVSLEDVVPKFTLDTICETAMGVKLTAFEDGDDYRHNVTQLQNYLVNRTVNPWYYIDWIYKLFGEKEICDKYLDKVHRFSSSIINKRRIDFFNKFNERNRVEQNGQATEKTRNAMLDTLLEAQLYGQDITHHNICEEVDTFMFEGFETTSIALTFALLMLALNSDIQEKVLKEIDDITDDVKSLTISDYSQFKYLECVLKETMRLYPSVPFISRGPLDDMTIGDLILPKYSMINIHIYDLHRDPNHFPDPEKFDPNRFLPENSTRRHPFVYIPFSAGLRNCIGQKFAMLEMKVFLVYIVKHFKILPVTKLEDIQFKIGLTLSTTEPIKVEFSKR